MAFFRGKKGGQKAVKMTSFFEVQFYRESSGLLALNRWKKAPKKGDFSLDYVGTFRRNMATPSPAGCSRRVLTRALPRTHTKGVKRALFYLLIYHFSKRGGKSWKNPLFRGKITVFS